MLRRLEINAFKSKNIAVIIYSFDCNPLSLMLNVLADYYSFSQNTNPSIGNDDNHPDVPTYL